MSDPGPAIAANELTKRYGPEKGEATVLAVDRVSFQVRPGEFFGFLGPNGAGKTTTIRMLTGLTKPTSGTMTVAGLDVAHRLVEVKERIGVVSDVANLYAELSARDNLDFVAKLQGMPRRRRAGRVEDLLRFLGLYRCRDRAGVTFSTGQRKRLMIAAALIHEPKILFLDEPTTGLDVRSARRIRELLTELNERGVTIFLTTHYIEEADQLCGRIAIINQGRIVTVDTPEALKSRIQRKKVIEVSFDRIVDGISRRLRALAGAEEVIVLGDRVRLTVADPSEVLPSMMDVVRQSRLKIIAVNTMRPSLEDAFVALTGLDPEAMAAEEGIPDRRDREG
jgi:ABC-2 type transport system ATP-binding protein